jgi:hypothetical protein
MSRPAHPFRLRLIACFLLASSGLGLLKARPAAAEYTLSGIYKCSTIEVSGTVRPCTAPSLELKSDGSYKLLSEVGSYEVVGGHWLVLSAAKRHGKGRLTANKEIVFEFISHGVKNRIIYRKKTQRPSNWMGV